jgi:hypothetical protein
MPAIVSWAKYKYETFDGQQSKRAEKKKKREGKRAAIFLLLCRLYASSPADTTEKSEGAKKLKT